MTVKSCFSTAGQKLPQCIFTYFFKVIQKIKLNNPYFFLIGHRELQKLTCELAETKKITEDYRMQLLAMDSEMTNLKDLGTIHILRKQFYSTKLNFTT